MSQLGTHLVEVFSSTEVALAVVATIIFVGGAAVTVFAYCAYHAWRYGIDRDEQ